MTNYFCVDSYALCGFVWSEEAGDTRLRLTAFCGQTVETIRHDFFNDANFITLLTQIVDGYRETNACLRSAEFSDSPVTVVYTNGVLMFYESNSSATTFVFDITIDPVKRAEVLLNVIKNHAAAMAEVKVFKRPTMKLFCRPWLDSSPGSIKKNLRMYTPFDIVSKVGDNGTTYFGMVSTVGNTGDASVHWFGDEARGRLKTAWWKCGVLMIVDNVMKITVNKMAGHNPENAETHFPTRYI